MTKADLVESIAQSTGLSKKDTNVVVNGILENISRALSDGDKVEFVVNELNDHRPASLDVFTFFRTNVGPVGKGKVAH